MPDDIPVEFKLGALLSSDALNEVQRLILRALAEHDHSGGANAAPITTAGLEDGAVTEPKLADLAVTLRTLASDAVDERVLADGAVVAGKVAASAVGTSALADGQVTQEKLSDEVQALLLRTGGGASSASQVIWRDPMVTFPPKETGTIIEGIIDPVEWDWEITTVSIDDNDKPIKFRPDRNIGQIVSVIEKETTPTLDFDRIEKQLNEAAFDAAVGAFAVGVGGFGKPQTTFGATAGIVNEVSFAREASGSFGAAPAATFSESAPVGAEPMMMRSMMMTAGPMTAEAASSVPTAPVTAQPKTATVLTKSVQSAIQRAVTLGTVNAEGKPVAPDDADAIVVNAGFSGLDSFIKDGQSVDFEGIASASATRQNQAAAAAGKILFNLGIDRDYLDEITAPANIREFWTNAYKGERGFFNPANPLWGGTSWLPEIFKRPELLGTGYSLSGGRNIRSVTREFNPTEPNAPVDTWVRVRFVTPYRNAAYAINITPRAHKDYAAIAANIRAKTVDYVDINFVALKKQGSAGVAFEDLSKLSFDLAVYGDLGEPR